ncbi:MAG TPA: glycosyltransferase family 2 protein [Blastocatellia bacterium]|jgi:cellulose synthase/poly-beta-1,6-N-acetylglucosamine synthase-like glycosyltransferase|nr:glycosyltransferase family 2 protein [Blastocatellia bacterium]
MTKSLFWISIAAITYAYVGYPVAVWLLARLRSQNVLKSPITPRVSVVIACHNEADNIEARIRNLFECDYPANLLEVIVVSDGSTDLTADVARRYVSDRVRVFAYDDRKGKAVALNVGVEAASGEIILFADARQRFEPGAISQLVANFADPRVGAASGELLLDGSDGASVGEGVGLYWKYEKWIRKSESRFSSVIGATGAIYAIRRELWEPLPPMTILDDVYTPMRIAMGGRRVVFEEKARAHDITTDSASREFSRKVRTLMGNYQLCQLMPGLLVPSGVLLYQFYSHKLMRLAAPIFLLILLMTNALVVASPPESAGASYEASLYEASFAAQLLFYASVLAGGYLLRRNRRVRLLNFAYVFSVMNAAALLGLVYFILGKRNVWVRVKG